VICGLEENEDAGVYRLSADTALVFTADFFAPVVDSPRPYGRIAAANALSDVYAMGGRPLMALNLFACPADLDPAVARAILEGGREKAEEAGCVIVGGHSVNDREPKYGMAVVGTVHPGRVMRNNTARPDDRLFLTKPLGVGLLTTALKRGVVTEGDLGAAIAAMETLNARASRLGLDHGATAATDVTGFGFLGHLMEMLTPSTGAEVDFAALPFHAGAMELARQSVFPGGAFANRQFYAPHVRFEAALEEEEQLACYGPETSGGLLLALPPERVEPFLAACARVEQGAWAVGRFTGGGGIVVQ
jgi:selenide,water dikinase